MAGRPTKHSKDLEKQAKEYIDEGYKELGHAIPSIVGLARALNIRKSTLIQLERMFQKPEKKKMNRGH